MVILTQYHTEIQNRGISTIGASEIFPVSRMPRFQRLHCSSITLPQRPCVSTNRFKVIKSLKIVTNDEQETISRYLTHFFSHTLYQIS